MIGADFDPFSDELKRDTKLWNPNSDENILSEYEKSRKIRQITLRSSYKVLRLNTSGPFMTTKSHFKQADVTRALKGAKRAGYVPVGCTIDESGSITLLFSDEDGSCASQLNTWDVELL